MERYISVRSEQLNSTYLFCLGLPRGWQRVHRILNPRKPTMATFLCSTVCLTSLNYPHLQTLALGLAIRPTRKLRHPQSLSDSIQGWARQVYRYPQKDL